MVKKLVLVLLAFVMVASFGACKKESETPITDTSQGVPAGHPGAGDEGAGIVPEVRETVVPDEVKGKWTGVKISIEDKKKNTSSDVVVKLGDTYSIPDSNIKIQVGDFLPDFKMAPGVYTSVSNEANNPAVHVVVKQGEEELFNNWIYSKFPAIHPFMHEQYGITLKEGIPAKG